MKEVKWLSFQGNFGDEDAQDLERTGLLEVTQLLAAALRSTGHTATEPEEYEGWAYEFGGDRGGLRFRVLVGSTDPVRPWVAKIEVETKASLWPFRSKEDPAPVLGEICSTIHSAISRDARISSIRWYTDEAWENDQDTGWTPRP